MEPANTANTSNFQKLSVGIPASLTPQGVEGVGNPISYSSEGTSVKATYPDEIKDKVIVVPNNELRLV